jgi:hypothetical protein
LISIDAAQSGLCASTSRTPAADFSESRGATTGLLASHGRHVTKILICLMVRARLDTGT